MSSVNNGSYNEEVKGKDKATINGYIHEIEENTFTNGSFYRTVPMVINYLCMKFYHKSKDRFHPILHSPLISIQNNTATVNAIIYDGRVAFLSNSVQNGVHQWEFKLNNINDSMFHSVYIGICDQTVHGVSDYVNGLFHWKVRNSFGLHHNGYVRSYIHHLDHYCEKMKGNDKIQMCLDLNKKELKYIINDKDYGKACDIPAGTYIVGVCLAGQGTSIELTEYNRK